MVQSSTVSISRFSGNYGGSPALFVRAQAGAHVAIRVSPLDRSDSILEIYLVQDGIEMYRGTAAEVTMRPEMFPVVRAAAGVHCPWYLAA